jgi:hypothetical protein
MVNSGRVCRVEDLRNVFLLLDEKKKKKKKKKEGEISSSFLTTLNDDDDENSEEEIIETEEQERGDEDAMDEVDSDGDDVYEVSVRVLGTLESFDPKNSIGVLKDNAFALSFDASSVLPTFKWKLKNLYFLIGEYEERETGGAPRHCSMSSSSSTPFSVLSNGVLRVRIAINASGLDVNAYHEAAKIREDFLR